MLHNGLQYNEDRKDFKRCFLKQLYCKGLFSGHYTQMSHCLLLEKEPTIVGRWGVTVNYSANLTIDLLTWLLAAPRNRCLLQSARSVDLGTTVSKNCTW